MRSKRGRSNRGDALLIPASEFIMRVKKVQEEVNRRGLDGVIVHSNESDFANVRYLSDYWPIFESTGVLVPKEGDPILLIGPESEAFAESRSKIRRICKILEYRESAEPEYPGLTLHTFESLFEEAFKGTKIRKLGIVGYSIMPLTVYERLRRAIPDTEFVRTDDILSKMRMIKSETEISLLKEAFRISEIAIEEIIQKARPGMTELEVVGIAQKAMYSNGAEYEGHPVYIFSGESSRFAIGRPIRKKIEKGKLVQLNVGARVGGYSSSVGRPICFGKMPKDMRRIVEVGLEAHDKTMEFMRAGVSAKEVVEKFYDFVRSKGCEENLLYGPCHGLGMMEVEPPWMELTSEYLLEENMTFQVDTFLHAKKYGLRWEDGVKVTKRGVEAFSGKRKQIIEIPR